MPDQAHGSELQAIEALGRRGIALDFADILSWECRERYLQQLTSHLRMEPPPNYNKLTIPQILKADRQVFLYLIRVGVQVKRLPDNSLDMDKRIFEALQSYEVGFHLLPLPRGAPAKADQPSTSASSGQPAQQPQQQWGGGKSGFKRWQPYKGGKGFGGWKSKGKGGKSLGQGLLPKGLLGRNNTSTDPHGRRLCYDYQFGRCTLAADGAECAKGWHLCCRQNCFTPRPECQHDKKVDGNK